MGIKSKIVSNTFYNTMDWALIAVIGYIFWMIMGKMLLPDAYGILMTVLVLYTFSVNLLSLNVQDVLGKFIPHYLATKKQNQAFSTATFMMAISLVLVGAFSILSYTFARNISLLVYSNTAMEEGIRLLSILTVFGYFYIAFKAILYGFQDFKGIFLADLAGGISRLFFSILFVYGGYMLGGILGWTVGFFFAAIIAFLCARSRGFRFKGIKGVNKKEIARYTSASIMIFFAHNLLVQLGTLLLGLLSTMHSVGLFGVAVLFGNFAVLPLAMIQGALFPTFSELLSRNELQKLSELLNRALKYIFAFSVPLLAIICLFPTVLIQIVYTSTYLEAWPAVVAYAPGMFILSVTSILLSLLFLSNRPYTRFFITSVAVIINFALAFLFIKNLDVFGAAAAFLLTSVSIFAFTYNHVQKAIGIRISIDAKKLLLPLPIFGILYFGVNMFSPRLIFVLFGFGIFYLLYLYMLFRLKFFNTEDAKLLDYAPDIPVVNPVKEWIRDAIANQAERTDLKINT